MPKKVALMSELVKTMAEGDKEEKEIPLPNVKSAILGKVVVYMKYHIDNPAKEIEKPLKSANMNEVVSQWDADFVDVDQEMLFELILVMPYRPHCCGLRHVRLTLGDCGMWRRVGRELHGHQAAAGFDVRQGGLDDQGQDPTTNSDHLQHRE